MTRRLAAVIPTIVVIPAEAGIQRPFIEVDSRFRGNDGLIVIDVDSRLRGACPRESGGVTG